jgi:STE24 endopeptidase
MTALTTAFLTFLAFMVGMRLYLARRQVTALQRGAGAPPAPFREAVTDAEHRRAGLYARDRLALGRVELIADALALLVVTLGGGFNWLDARLAGLGLGPVGHGVAVLACLSLLLGAWSLPFAIWSTFRIEAKYGFNRQTPALYALDLLRSLALGAALGLPLLALVLWLMQSAGALWWLYAWAAWVAFGLLLTALYPRFLAPLFNRFEPLAAGELRDRLERLVAACGFAADGLYVMDGSRRSSHGNAYFTGIGRHKRIVLFDTLVARLEPAELEAVLAHELGHFRLHHVRVRLLLGMLSSFVGFAILGYACRWPGFYSGLGVASPSMHAALALFMLAVPVFVFPIGPLSAWWSRRDEFAADRYAAAHASAAALATALVKLYRDNASSLTTDPLYSAWHDSHPPALERIAALNSAGSP